MTPVAKTQLYSYCDIAVWSMCTRTYMYTYLCQSIQIHLQNFCFWFFFSLMYSNTKYVDCCLFQTVTRNFSAAIIIQYNMQRNYRHSILPWSTHHFKGHVFSIQANNSGLVFIVWHNIKILKDSIINVFPLTGHLSDSDRCSKWPSDSWHLVQGFTYIKTCDQLKHQLIIQEAVSYSFCCTLRSILIIFLPLTTCVVSGFCCFYITHQKCVLI